MTVYDFAFVLDADPHDEALAEILAAPPLDDGTLILQNGAYALSFDREAATYKEAVLSAYADIKSVGISILSFDPDYLVSATEIADRAGVSKAAVSKYAHSDGTFPTPVRLVLSSRPLYDWVQVSRWFSAKGALDVSEYHKAIVSRVVNFGAQAEKASIPLDVSALIDKAIAAA